MGQRWAGKNGLTVTRCHIVNEVPTEWREIKGLIEGQLLSVLPRMGAAIRM